MEFLKALFEAGALTFDQFVEAIGKTDIKLANLASGEYVDKNKFDAKVEELKTARSNLEEAGKTIEGFKSLDVDGIKKQADDWKEKFEKAEEQTKRTLHEVRVKAIAEKENFSCLSAKKAFVADLLAKDLQFDGETLLGYADFKKAYTEADPLAFGTADGKPRQLPPVGTSGQPLKLTKEEFRKLPYADRVKLKDESPALYEELRK